jgi:hypothetical protein
MPPGETSTDVLYVRHVPAPLKARLVAIAAARPGKVSANTVALEALELGVAELERVLRGEAQ